MLAKISSMAYIIDNTFFQAYGGESKDGFLAARFSTGDTVSFSVIAHSSSDDASQIDLSSGILATLQVLFPTMDGATSAVCLKKNYNINNISDRGASDDCILIFRVWESLESCYSYTMRSDRKYVIVPFLEGLSLYLKHDIFRVIYVSGDNVLNFQHSPWPPHFVLLSDRDKNSQGNARM